MQERNGGKEKWKGKSDKGSRYLNKEMKTGTLRITKKAGKVTGRQYI